MNMKSKMSLLALAILAVSMLAVFPIPVKADPANFGYTYPIVQNPDFAWVGELAPGQWSEWVTVNVTIEKGPGEKLDFPVYQDDGWIAEVTDNGGTKWYWAVEAVPGPKYTWTSITESVTVKIRVQVPEDWTEECDHTFNVKLKPGYDSGKKSIGSGDGVHFKVCIKIPPTQVFEIECESFMTDSSFIPIDHFDTVFTPRDKKGRDYYKLASTNPGQFMFNIRITNIGDIAAESLEVAYTIDEDFILKGADPIQVWTDYGRTGTRIYDVTIIDGTIINAPLEPGETIWITFHLEYGPAREIWSAEEVANWKALHEPNTFSADCTAYAEGWDPATCYSEFELPDSVKIRG
ncbi:MAG: hypothetical protein QXH97_05935 [Candidatus Bathyarchaeia archaeon]